MISDKLLRNVSFGLLGIITVAMAAATLVERLGGTAMAMSCIYHSPAMIAAWGVAAAVALAYIVRRSRLMPRGTILLHVALVVILAGAAVTYFGASRGILVIEEGGDATDLFTLDSGRGSRMPFAVGLRQVRVICYPGTSTPMDYESELEITQRGITLVRTVSMNRVLSIDGYRFYQTSLAPGRSTLTVAHDPWGIGVSYAGYALLALSIGVWMVQRRRYWVSLLRSGAVAALLLVWLSAAAAPKSDAGMPKTLQRPLARDFGMLYAEWGGRVVPLQTVARDFCLKVYGSDSYRGLTPEQVLTGWLFYYDSWKHEPMIRIKGDVVRGALGVDGRYASLADFYASGRYLLDGLAMAGADASNVMGADERVGIVTQILTGRGLRIIPVATGTHPGDSAVEWISWVDPMPAGASPEARAGVAAISASVDRMARSIAHGRYIEADSVVHGIRRMQQTLAGNGGVPSQMRFDAERLYNRIAGLWLVAGLAVAAGVIGLFWRRIGMLRLVVTALLFAWLTLLMVLQWIVGGHIPMSNGYETMETMAWIALLVALACHRRGGHAATLATLVAGLALMVAAMGQNNPMITPLMPVLASPLLSVHVFLVMTSYALFAMMMLNSVVALVRRREPETPQRLASLSEALLYPAVFALALGIFVGAVWANQSWGRYWGWDPKETWALITLLVYAWPLHRQSFGCFRRPAVLHTYLFVAFLAVLFTYFGVNFLLAGLHSYANG